VSSAASSTNDLALSRRVINQAFIGIAFLEIDLYGIALIVYPIYVSLTRARRTFTSSMDVYLKMQSNCAQMTSED